MSRPFLAKSIYELEVAFEESVNDQIFLQILQNELSRRSTDRAKKLKARVDVALQIKSNSQPVKPKNNSSAQPSLVSTEAKLSQQKASPPSLTRQTKPPQVFSMTEEEKARIREKVEHEKRGTLSNTVPDILSTWTALEVLSPQVYRPEKDRSLIVSLENEPLPWEGKGENSRPKYRLYYEVVLGTIELDKAVSALLEIYADGRIERPSVKGKGLLATVIIDRTGKLVSEPAAAVSSFGWGAKKALQGDLSEISEWPAAEQEFVTRLEKILRRTDDDGNEMPLDQSTIYAAYKHIAQTLGLPNDWMNPPSFAKRHYIYYKNQDPPESSLLNSFFLNDLTTVKGLFHDGKSTSNLRAYLGMDKPTKRLNLLNDNQALESAVAPNLIPPARWPGPGRHSLVLLQQAAVNLAISELKDTGILAVNGPPGTGKTTLLRDVLASIVTQRAEIMCNFENPADAFETTGQKLRAGQAWLHFYKCSQKLQGYEVLIASSNNKAVENVSAELPGLHAIADDATDLRYFGSLATGLVEKESWGLIAAVLGNATNRSKFRQTFWWDNDIGLSTYFAEASGTPQIIEVKNPQTGQIIEERRPKIVIESDAPDCTAQALKRWRDAREEFKQALATSKSTLADLSRMREAVVNLSSLAAIEHSSLTEFQAAQTAETNVRSHFERAEKFRTHTQETFKKAQSLQKRHRAQKPSFFSRLFQRAVYASWKEEWKQLIQNTTSFKQERDHSFAVFSKVNQQLKQAIVLTKTKEEQYLSAVQLYADAQKLAEKVKTGFPDLLIDDDFFALSHPEKHKTTPWCDKATQRLRDNVFIASIKLHKAFIDAAARPLRHNLGLLMQVLSGRTFPDAEKQALVRDLWASFFLVVPSVSTTFASVERMLGKLPPESLGWLLVDEAGQALPQAAVGAIMRTKRAVIVGDPIQIEPVVALPDTLTQNICRHFGVDPDHFNAPEASVQTIADAATPYYAEFDGKHGSRSVGVPLLVHRRCADPMFSISNAIAYERLMVQAKQAGLSRIKDCLGPSSWIDVQGQAQEKWCPDEGNIVLELLTKLKRANLQPNLYIVTPFVIVQDNLRRSIHENGILQNWVNAPYSWTSERVGTVHTVQGREAEAVIFVLGAPSPAQIGARGWAGGRPNLLNVAVTRAKEAVYVIGNRRLWHSAGLFKELSDRLS